MNTLWQLLNQGGPIMVPLVLLSIVLYARCFGLYFTVRSARRQIAAAPLIRSVRSAGCVPCARNSKRLMINNVS